MPRKSKKSTTARKDKHPFSKFVNFNLGSTDKDQINDMLMNGDDCLVWLDEMAQAGYAFKAAWDVSSDCLQVMLIGERTVSVNEGCIMSARHTDMAKAITILRYQHEKLSLGLDWDKEDRGIFSNDW